MKGTRYHDTRWKKTREAVLRRDAYQCKECLRYGKITLATTVHHIKPVEKNPELYLNSKNLISCCSSCHNSFHDRDTNELTEKGIKVVERIFGRE